MICVSGLVKRFGTFEVLRGVDVVVSPGRITGIIGPNGAGKSTLIKMVLGLVRPTAGRIRVGHVVVGEDDAYRARVGYMPQTARFPDNLTARELIATMRDLRGGDGPVTVELDGGELTVDVGEDLHVDLAGWALPVYAGEVSEDLLAELAGMD